MSRALRKLRGSLDAAQDLQDSDQDDGPAPATPPRQNLFGLLSGDDNSDGDVDAADQDEDDVDSASAARTTTPQKTHNQTSAAAKNKKKKKKKAKKTAAAVGDGEPGSAEPPVSAARRPVARGKQPAQTNHHSNDNVDDDSEDIDQILREIGDSPTEAASTTADPSKDASPSRFASALFAVDVRLLDANVELKRIFGAKVVNIEVKRKQYTRASTGRRTVLSTPRENWSPFSGTGLSMEQVEPDPSSSPTPESTHQLSFCHSRSYQQVQFQFINAVDTHDPNAIAALLQMHPYHIDALLQLSEVSKHEGDIATASELIERALYAFERAFHPLFNITNGTCRLSFDRVENRPFFLSLHRHIGYLSRRGCWCTAFEVVKLLAVLDPEQDPMCCLLSIDFYAIRAGKFEWYRRFWDEFEKSKGLRFLPNASFSIALVEWEIENASQKSHEKSSQLLREAIGRFPSVVSELYKRIGITDTSVTNNAFFYSYTEHRRKPEFVLQILTDYYVELSHSLWKIPDVQSWLRSQVTIVCHDLSATPRPKYITTGIKIRGTKYGDGTVIPRNIQRAMFLTDTPAFHSRIPRETVQSGVLMYDPIPPVTAIPSVYDAFRAERERAMNPFVDMSTLEALVRSLLPWIHRGMNAGQVPVMVDGDGVGGVAAADAAVVNQPGFIQRIAAELMRRHQQLPQQQGHPENDPVDAHVAHNVDLIMRELPGVFPVDAVDDPVPQDAIDNPVPQDEAIDDPVAHDDAIDDDHTQTDPMPHDDDTEDNHNPTDPVPTERGMIATVADTITDWMSQLGLNRFMYRADDTDINHPPADANHDDHIDNDDNIDQ